MPQVVDANARGGSVPLASATAFAFSTMIEKLRSTLFGFRGHPGSAANKRSWSCQVVSRGTLADG